MADRGGAASNFLWLLIGFFLGVLATLGSLVFFDRQAARRPAEPAAATEPAPAAKAIAPASATAPAPAPAPSPARVEPENDAQVAEDAAAAGMTTRPQSSDPAGQ